MPGLITVETVLQRVKLGLNDNGVDSVGASSPTWLSDVEYDSFIWAPGNVVQKDAVHRFTWRSSGRWTLDGGEWAGNPYVLHLTSADPFTAYNLSTTYNVSCWGNISTTATDTTAYYEVTGCIIDYAAIMAELYFWLANHRSIQIAAVNGMMIGDTASYLRKTAQQWQGISDGGSMRSQR
jgi:hypothetical protein